MTGDLEARVGEAVAAIRAHSGLVPRVGLTLGSGLARLVEAVERPLAWPTEELPHWPRSTVAGHRGRLILGRWAGIEVAVLSGRSHHYEGYGLDQVTFGVRVLRALGARTLIFTNAAGAVSRELVPGDLMLATDHINWIGTRGMLTASERRERRSGRAVAPLHSAELAAALREAAVRAGVPLGRGVLLGGKGPAYETAAEIRFAAAAGADAACMSTVPEVTLAAHLGARAASFSCITNRATGLSQTPLTHEEVTEVAGRAVDRLRAVLEEYLRAGAP